MSATSPLGRHWATVLAITVGVTLWMVHTLTFGPLAARYRTQLTQAGEIGASLDPRLAAAPLPTRVALLFQANSVTAVEADRLSQSGSLATDLVRRVSETAVAAGINVASSQPGAASQTATTIEVRAQLRLQGSYEQLVSLLGALAREGTFYRIEALSLTPLPKNAVEADVRLARMLLKRIATTP